MAYTYKKCSKCGSDKEENKGAYCKPCSAKYYKIYRFKRANGPNINKKGLESFVNGIIQNSYLIDFQDISNIIFFYSIITNDITEYNKYNSGKQVLLMWNRILEHLDKIKDKKKYI
jgi:hypothetical protein